MHVLTIILSFTKNIVNMLHSISRHVQEHMKIPLDTSRMSTDELLFHYFKMMDVDMNAKLDGGELVAAVLHYSGFVVSCYFRYLNIS